MFVAFIYFTSLHAPAAVVMLPFAHLPPCPFVLFCPFFRVQWDLLSALSSPTFSVHYPRLEQVQSHTRVVIGPRHVVERPDFPRTRAMWIDGSSGPRGGCQSLSIRTR